MKLRLILLPFWLSLAVAAGAQEATPTPEMADPIAALLANLPPDQTTDMDAEEPAPTAPPPPRQDAPLAVPSLSRLPKLDRPVMIGETHRRPDAPPTDVEIAYENRVRASLQAAQGLQGPLDGAWTVRDAGGASIYAFQLVDKGYGSMPEGAWRALGGSGRVGLIDSLDRQPVSLTVRITRTPGKPPTVLTLTPRGAGEWAGDLTDETGSRSVVMRRN